MIPQEKHYETELAVIGTGLAGFAASLFAQQKGLSTTQIGDTGAIAYTTGYFDLLGAGDNAFALDPWQAHAALRSSEPKHVLARIPIEDIAAAFALFTAEISRLGVGYSKPNGRNHMALLPAGAVKPTYSVPLTMLPGLEAKRNGAKTLILDILGLQGFSAGEFIANLRGEWPQLASSRLSFPDMESGAQVYAEVMARALEVPQIQEQFAGRVRALKGDAQAIGLPAIMGIHNADQVHERLTQLVGVPLFEIPTIPPAVPGIRLREMFEQKLPAEGLVLVPHQKVAAVDLAGEERAVLHIKDNFGSVEIKAQAVILATGRFLSGGLKADHFCLKEPLLDLPVTQPKERKDWYRKGYFDPRGHGINRVGIEVNDAFRPLDHEDRPVDKRLFAAGALLAHQDWIRQRCGAGIAIASAYKAVQSIEQYLRAPV